MKKIIKPLTILVLPFFLLSSAKGEDLKKVAQTGLQFLKVDMLASAAAMGGAFTMAGKGANAMFYNKETLVLRWYLKISPAGLLNIPAQGRVPEISHPSSFASPSSFADFFKFQNLNAQVVILIKRTHRLMDCLNGNTIRSHSASTNSSVVHDCSQNKLCL